MPTPNKGGRPWRINASLYEALTEAVLQIEYLHEKFAVTGTGEAVLARGRAALALARGESK